jgi:tetratricopeptide (TPR) repeat protein
MPSVKTPEPTESVDQLMHEVAVACQRQQFDAAAELCARVLAVAPDHGEALSVAGGLALARGRVEEARILLTRAVAAAPRNAIAWTNLGECSRLAGNLSEARQAVGRALALDPAQSDALNTLGLLEMAGGSASAAIVCYRRALAARPAFPLALFNLGIALEETMEFAEAIFSYRSALALHPGLVPCLMRLAGALRKTGDLAGAIATLRAAIAASPPNFELHILLGDVQFDAGNVGDARGEWQRALALAPDNEEINARLLAVSPVWDETLCGRRIMLVPCSEAHASLVMELLRHAPTRRNMRRFTMVPATIDSIRIVIRQQRSLPVTRRNALVWAIVRTDGVPIGIIEVSRPDWRNRSAEIIVGILPARQSKGYVIDAFGLLLDRCFKVFDFNKMRAYTYADNEVSGRILEACGFRHESMLREEYRDPVAKQFIDVNGWAITASEFYTNPFIAKLWAKVRRSDPST